MNDADIDTLPLLDTEIIAELRDVMEEAFTDLTHMFLTDLPLQLDRLQIAVAENDAKEINQIAHKLKSSCGSFGALRLAELMRRLEQAGRQKTLDDAVDLLQRTQVIAEETCSRLRALPG
ncbi:MAG: Hpt domain-containing protein [Candidatus Contendobacter sp.]|nr:Hpt domain-containing protein [Candidatus Contendobacter sp.]